MSRLPQPSSSSPNPRTRLKSTPTVPSSSLRAPVTPLAKPRAKTPTATASPSPVATAKPRVRTPSAAPTPTLRSQPSLKTLKAKSPIKSPARKPQALPAEEDVPPPPPKPQLSIREQIALKRAEVKKVVKTSPVNGNGEFAGLEDASPQTYKAPEPDVVDLGRWSIKETIERARSSGAINLSSRDLPCIPSALFEIHLGVTPEPLKSAPVEPPIGESGAGRRRGNGDAPSWYEAQDLEVLKAWSNEIVEIQSELSMFGSLKTVDLHNNKIAALPDTFADLTALTTVDLSHNQLTSLPANFWALPHLTTLNLSHNSFTALPFSAPFGSGSNPLGRTKDSRGDWFTQTITRATEPLPRLVTLDVSYNHLTAASIEHSTDGPGLPALLAKFDLSGNPLGKCDSLFRALGRLERLRELHMLKADIGDDSFPVSVFANANGSLFPMLKVLDLEETQVTRPAIEAVFTPNALKQTIQYEVTNQEPPDGVLRIIVGKRVIKESWEIEAERRTKQRRQAAFADNVGLSFTPETKVEVVKEPWEEDLLSEGAKRRARAAAAAAPTQRSEPSTSTSPPSKAKPAPLAPQKKVVEKEAWEIEAEQGLLSAGGRRRARAAAAAAAAEPTKPANVSRTPSPSSSQRSHTPPSVGAALANPQYYDAAARTLTLPTSAPPTKAHTRSISLAAPAWSKGPATGVSELALAIPSPTLPLAAIATQPLAQNLKVLILANRRADCSFSIPTNPGLTLPYLEELSLENCNLGDSVPVTHVGEGVDEFALPRTNEPLLPLLAKLFPSVRNLNLSYNALTSAALSKEALAALVFADTDGDGVAVEWGRKGLRQLHLRGNRLNELDGFQQIAERFRGNRDVPEWKLEELDLRDNEIGKLPPELGLLPLDVFLVDGNTFRVPPRRVWEREGTKGLLSWLRGRIE
ncbi:hypothetical protein C8Q76DRAFT_816931 [Earliella scabrosa]|nr:hypothetical protein C8Q76DRAFT_816931 [Earliella scabrosa]